MNSQKPTKSGNMKASGFKAPSMDDGFDVDSSNASESNNTFQRPAEETKEDFQKSVWNIASFDDPPKVDPVYVDPPDINRNKGNKSPVIIASVLTGVLLIVLAIIFIVIPRAGLSDSDSDTRSVTDALDYAYDVEKEAVIEKDDTSGLEYVSNIVIVYFDDSASESDKQSVVDSVNGEIVGRMDSLDQLQIKIEEKSYSALEDLCDEIESDSHVVATNIDMVLGESEGAFYPSDGYDDDWDVNCPSGQNWAQEAINAPYVWGYKDQMSEVAVAVVDTGFDTSNSDLTHLTISPSTQKSHSAEPDHGTFVAGLVGADLDNGVGISGMAPNAKITGYPTASKNPTSIQLIDDVVRAIKEGNKVINVSFGTSANLKDCYSTYDYYNQGREASLQISKMIDSGFDFIIVQSAGNGAEDEIGVDSVYNGMFSSITAENCYTDDHSYSEIMDHVVIVASAGMKDDGSYELSSFSNGGSNATVCAPGEYIYGLVPGGDLASGNGTSFSAPLVTGTIAAMWGINPDLTSAEIKSILCDTCSETVPAGSASPSVSGSYKMIDAGTAVSVVDIQYTNPVFQEDTTEEITEEVTEEITTEEVTTEEAPVAATAEEGFKAFLEEKYFNANAYSDGCPMFYDADYETGDPDPNNGSVWFEYAVEDFDADGEIELMVYKKTYGGQEYSESNPNLLAFIDLYEWTNNEVILKDTYMFEDDLHDDTRVSFNDAGVLYDEVRDEWGGHLSLYLFNDNLRNSFGLYSGEYLFYSPNDVDFTSFTVYHSCGFYLGDPVGSLTNSEYIEETDGILTGNYKTLNLHPVTESGINEGF